jgi:hypothetical protein
MARGHPDLPQAVSAVRLSKVEIFHSLQRVDADTASRKRVLAMETDFRRRISTHLSGLPANDAQFRKFFTSPFVLMFYSRQQNYQHVGQVEKDLVPAKVFSSMETSAGRMVEYVTLPVYGWEPVESTMHSHTSVLDGRKLRTRQGQFVGATLKSGPRTLNDEMAQNIGEDIVANASAWALDKKSNEVHFTYDVLYGTKQQSNKKDWHILRHIEGSLSRKAKVTSSHKGKCSIGYEDGPLSVSATVRVGLEWWEFLGGRDAWIELCCALIRACVDPGSTTNVARNYTISDLADILALPAEAQSINVSVLQKSQLEWLLFLARHFCDELTN